MFNPTFSHIYYESDAIKFKTAQRILKKLDKSETVEISKYEDVFYGFDQNYVMQKKSQNIILAVKRKGFLFKGSPYCHNPDNLRPFYSTPVVNCIYNCVYCYLQGNYSSGNILVFVNQDDFILACKQESQKGSIYLPVSYDSDMLALEQLLQFSRYWIEKTRSLGNGSLIEIRTKSANYKSICDLEPSSNIILSWSLSPKAAAVRYEEKTPGISARLESMKSAIDDGWKVRICIDPVIFFDGWKEAYAELLHDIFSKVDAERVYDLTTGPFRMPSGCLERIRKIRPLSEIVNYPFEVVNKTCTYSKTLRTEMMNHICRQSERYIDSSYIFPIST